MVVFSEGSVKQIGSMSRTNLYFILISGLTAGISLLFYFRALQIGQASQVSPIDKLSLVSTVLLAALFLGEKLTFYKLTGAFLMGAGAILISISKQLHRNSFVESVRKNICKTDFMGSPLFIFCSWSRWLLFEVNGILPLFEYRSQPRNYKPTAFEHSDFCYV